MQELAERYRRGFTSWRLRHMKNREDAEEVTQDVLLKVYRKIDKFRGDSALSSWIYRITFNTAMSRLRTHRAQRAAEEERDRAAWRGPQETVGQPTPRQAADWSHMPDEELLRRQLREAVANALPHLPEIYRVPVVLAGHRGAVDGRGEHSAAREGSDAEVAPASGPRDAEEAARRPSPSGLELRQRLA